MNDARHEQLREQVVAQLQGAIALDIGYFGVVNGLFEQLGLLAAAEPSSLAQAAGKDAGYVTRWCDAAYAAGYLEVDEHGRFVLSELGEAFRPDNPDTLMPFAIQAMLAAHMAERASALAETGERPGEGTLAERETLVPWFGRMLEAQFAPFFEHHILPNVPVYREVDARGGLAVDLGCGNGWYLRALARRYPHVRGVGMDTSGESIGQARAMADAEGTGERLTFIEGDLNDFRVEEPADLIAMNRALHHVWDDRETVFKLLSGYLRPGGTAVIWEPHWPKDRATLRDPGRRVMAFQNLAEHVQGNRFLEPEEVEAQLQAVGLATDVYLFADGREAVITGTRPA